MTPEEKRSERRHVFAEAIRIDREHRARKLDLFEKTRVLVSEMLVEGFDQETIEKLVRDQVRKFNS